MKNLELNLVKKMFYKYSPLKTNKELLSITKTINNLEITANIDNIRYLYNKIIIKSFLNETVIKSAFIRKFGFKKSPRNTVTIFELNSGNSRADLCMVNGETIVYEIKTEYDTYNRLDNQLDDYLKLHDYVNIIIPESQIDIIKDKIDDKIGIISYNQNRLGNINFNEYREAKTNNQIDSFKQLSQLTTQELLQITNLSKSSKDDLIKYILLKYDNTEISDIYRSYLKRKYFEKWNFVYTNKDSFQPLDYQWFFKNNLPAETVYK